MAGEQENFQGGEGNGDEHVEENQVNPEVHKVARVEVDAADEPLRAKGHESAVQLGRRNHDHGDVGARVLSRNVVADEEGGRPDDEDGEELEADDALHRIQCN